MLFSAFLCVLKWLDFLHCSNDVFVNVLLRKKFLYGNNITSLQYWNINRGTVYHWYNIIAILKYQVMICWSGMMEMFNRWCLLIRRISLDVLLKSIYDRRGPQSLLATIITKITWKGCFSCIMWILNPDKEWALTNRGIINSIDLGNTFWLA